MKYIKLFILSVVVFGLVIFLISLLFPSVTYVSRAMTLWGRRDSVRKALPRLFTKAFSRQDLVTALDFNATQDTLHFSINGQEEVSGAMAVYAMCDDSTTVQVFYTIKVPWYKPWQKFGLMINEQKYGPSLDTAISRVQQSL
ncbi:MAG: hypothetical protein ABIX01_03225 [Chitinophagaceae bacterium]